MQVPILKQGAYLIATVQSALSDEDLKQLRDTLVQQVSKVRARGVATSLDLEEGLAYLDPKGKARDQEVRAHRG